MNRFILSVLFLCALTGQGFAAVQGQDVEYKSGDVTLKGYLAYDDASKDKRPGILVVHEWWGHNEYARKRARMLAELGYTAFAVDMYGNGKVAMHPKDAAAFMQEVVGKEGESKARFMAAFEVLKKFPLTNPQHIAAIGYCFGGATVLNMAMSGVPLDGVVSFHGALPSPAAELSPGQVKTKILVCHGGADQFITAEQISTFKQLLDKAKADYQFNIYDGAKHSFTNPDADQYAVKFNMPVGYNAKADQASWEDMKKFLQKLWL